MADETPLEIAMRVWPDVGMGWRTVDDGSAVNLDDGVGGMRVDADGQLAVVGRHFALIGKPEHVKSVCLSTLARRAQDAAKEKDDE